MPAESFFHVRIFRYVIWVIKIDKRVPQNGQVKASADQPNCQRAQDDLVTSPELWRFASRESRAGQNR
jgi:hypothetical protein